MVTRLLCTGMLGGVEEVPETFCREFVECEFEVGDVSLVEDEAEEFIGVWVGLRELEELPEVIELSWCAGIDGALGTCNGGMRSFEVELLGGTDTTGMC